MTPEQVSALSDVELNRAMIWLYPKAVENLVEVYACGDWSQVICGDDIHIECDEGYVEALFTRDWGVTMPLAVENKLKHGYTTCASGLSDELIYYAYDQDLDIESNYCPALLRAYCEVLVLIKYQ